MPVSRGPNFKQIPLNIAGSSVYGLYDKVGSQVTFNMTVSDNFLVPYPGYKVGIPSSAFNNSKSGRGFYESVKLNRIISVFDSNVYLTFLSYSHQQMRVVSQQVRNIGQLQTSEGVVYISENNKPQILISDGANLYLYDPSLSAQVQNFTAQVVADTITVGSTTATFSVGEPITFKTTTTLPAPLMPDTTYYIYSIDSTSTPGSIVMQLATSQSDIVLGIPIMITSTGTGTHTLMTNGSFQIINTIFTPGYITFHDTYFIAAASDDNYYLPAANNTWRLSSQDNGFIWGDTSLTVGLLESKPDNTQAVVRFPSKGNMILVMGETVTEFWYDTGAQLFPYQRQNQSSIDYGCLNPATVAYMDEIVVWLARNEKSGPIIMYTTGGMPQKVTTDGIDYQLSEIENPESSEGFIFRKNGHLFYHINFYADNLSFVVDFTANKIYNACDQNRNYYSMGKVVWFNNQYFSLTKDNGNLFIFDTVFYNYDFVDSVGNVTPVEIPRIRVCDNIRLPSQDYFVINDVGFTIETGNTDYYDQSTGPIYFITQNGNYLVTNDTTTGLLVTQDDNNLVTQDGSFLSTETPQTSTSYNLISQQMGIIHSTPRVDFSVSYDGGSSYGADFPYVLNPIGLRKNRLMWWQGGISNDAVCQFKFWGFNSRWVCTNGVVNVRQ